MLESIFLMYTKYGKSLEELGFEEAVIPAEILRENLYHFENENLIILGGTTYIEKGQKFDMTFEGWNYEGRRISESISIADYNLSQIRDKGVYVAVTVVLGEGKSERNLLDSKWKP